MNDYKSTTNIFEYLLSHLVEINEKKEQPVSVLLFVLTSDKNGKKIIIDNSYTYYLIYIIHY
jgi:hypothetical protein